MLKPAKLPISAFVSDYDHNAYQKGQLVANAMGIKADILHDYKRYCKR